MGHTKKNNVCFDVKRMTLIKDLNFDVVVVSGLKSSTCLRMLSSLQMRRSLRQVTFLSRIWKRKTWDTDTQWLKIQGDVFGVLAKFFWGGYLGVVKKSSGHFYATIFQTVPIPLCIYDLGWKSWLYFIYSNHSKDEPLALFLSFSNYLKISETNN